MAFTGCFNAILEPTDFHTFRDTGENTVTDLLRGNELGCGGGLNLFHLYFNPARIRDGMDHFTYVLYLRYTGEWAAGIRKANSLTVVVDGKRSLLRTRTVPTKTELLGTQLEFATFDVTFGDLDEMARAHEVKVELEGRNDDLYRCFDESNFRMLTKFVEAYPPR